MKVGEEMVKMTEETMDERRGATEKAASPYLYTVCVFVCVSGGVLQNIS